MASNQFQSGPVCLIENTANNELQVNPAALDILSQINQPVVVVAIAGFYRTGKSYLLNRLAGRTSGFALGSTVESKTKGIWMWCVPHRNPKLTLVLLDTEGLGDVNKGDRKNDTHIFSLAVLLSSTLVYNSMGTIDNFAVENLQFVTELADVIKVKSKADDDDEEEDDCNLIQFFPNFVWVVRDMTLKLEIDKREVTADQYLEKALELKKGVKKSVMEYNLPRQCIRRYFPSRKCFVFVRPISSNNFDELETLEDNKLDPQFVQQTNQFCDHIFSTAPIKNVKGGHKLTGNLFGILVQTYVRTIQSGEVPCMENAVLAMANIENERAVQEGLNNYVSKMESSLIFPTEDKVISDLHKVCERESLQIFMNRSFRDEDQLYQKRLMEGFGKKYSELLEKNESSSRDICLSLLQKLSTNLEKNLTDGVYAQPGGFQLYSQDRDKVVENYNSSPNKGVKAEEMLSCYLENRKSEAESILQADKNLSSAQKTLAEEQEKAKILEQNQREEQEKRIQAEQRMKDREESHQENIRQLQIKMERETEDMKRELEGAMTSKLKEQEILLSQGFKEQANAMTQEIDHLKQELQSQNNSVADMIGKIASAVEKGISLFIHLKDVDDLARNQSRNPVSIYRQNKK